MSALHLKIVGHELCPYVQRAVITMFELEVAFERTDIRLDDKPDWLLEISPTEKVPVLIVNDGAVLFESNVIAEYLMEVHSKPFHPVDALQRAIHRAWIAYADQILGIIANLIYRVQTQKQLDQCFADMTKMFAVLEAQVGGDPYFSGNKFHLIDAVYATVFRYLPVVGSLTPRDVLRHCPKLSHWASVLAKRSSVKRAVPEQYDSLLHHFIREQSSLAASQLT